MKYGVIVYQEAQNIGDDIQSYAAARLLPHVDYYIEREQLDVFRPKEDEPVHVIMNGWFMYNKLAWPVSPCINPLYLSMHFWEKDALEIHGDFLDGLGGEDLKAHEPIGCRDSETKQLLEQHGISAWLSGCLTLTLDPVGPVQKENYICLTDVSEEVERYLRKNYPQTVFRCIGHEAEGMVSPKDNWQKRFENVENLLRTYQNAKAVITTRLHCALPCLALETPVLLLSDEQIPEPGRFDGLATFTHHCTTQELLKGESGFDLAQPPANPSDYLEKRENLLRVVAQFLQKCDSDQDILKKRFESFNGDWVRRAQWKNEQIVSLQQKAISRWNQTHEEMEHLEEGRRWLEGQYQAQKNQLDTLYHELAEQKRWSIELEQGKDWLESQCRSQSDQLDKLDNALAEQKHWSQQLEKDKNWLENQWTSSEKKYANLLVQYERIPSWIRAIFKKR